MKIVDNSFSRKTESDKGSKAFFEQFEMQNRKFVGQGH